MRHYHTVNEIALELNLSTRTVYRMLESGLLKGYKTGRVWRVSHDDLQEYLSHKSNYDGDQGFENQGPFSSSFEYTYRSYNEITISPHNEEQIAGYRLLLERRYENGHRELFLTPLTVDEQSASFRISRRLCPGEYLILPRPGKSVAAINYFLNASETLWQKLKILIQNEENGIPWQRLFNLPGLDDTESLALQWAYNLDDPLTRIHVEGASVPDRLVLLEKLPREYRRAALASLEILYGDDGF